MTKADREAHKRLKYEIAMELGLGDKLRSGGWGQLTAREAGRIGGIKAAMARKTKEER